MYIVDFLMDSLKKFSPFILGGAIGSIIHRMRTEMNFITFLKSIIISIFISICVGILCKDYLEIHNDNIIFVFCGISGTFSKIILDEIEQIIKLAPIYVKDKLGLTKKEDQ